MTFARLKCPNVTKSATQLVAAAMTPRPCGPRNRAVMTVPSIAPIIQYAFVPLVSVTAFHNRISGDSLGRAHSVEGSLPDEQRVRPPRPVALVVEVVERHQRKLAVGEEGVDLVEARQSFV